MAPPRRQPPRRPESWAERNEKSVGIWIGWVRIAVAGGIGGSIVVYQAFQDHPNLAFAAFGAGLLLGETVIRSVGRVARRRSEENGE